MLMCGCTARLVLMLTCLMTLLSSGSPEYCRVAGPTDVIIGLGDSFTTMTQWWGRTVYSPGVIKFVHSLLRQFHFSQVRVSLFAFSSSVRRISPFSRRISYLNEAVASQWIPQFRGLRTFTGIKVFLSYMLSRSRPGASRIIILVSNRPSDNYFMTITQSMLARDENIHFLYVGYGRFNMHLMQESLMITGDRRRVFRTTNDLILFSLVPSIKYMMCELTTADREAIEAAAPVIPAQLPAPGPPPGPVIRPVDIILVADHSQSVRLIEGINATYCVQCVEFIVKLIDRLNFPRCSMGITMFADDAFILSSISEEAEPLKISINSVNSIEIPYAGSSLESGIAIAREQFGNSTRPRFNRKVIVVLCDGSGEDDAKVRSNSQSARADGIMTYVLTWPSPGGIAINDAQLTDIAGASHRIIKVDNLVELPSSVNPLADMICPDT